jgi:hypothetical protein
LPEELMETLDRQMMLLKVKSRRQIVLQQKFASTCPALQLSLVVMLRLAQTQMIPL